MNRNTILADNAPSSAVGVRAAGPKAGRVEVHVVRTVSELNALEPEWRRLEAKVPALPFLSFDWSSAWWDHLRAKKFSLKDRLFVRAFRTTEGELVGVAPMMLTERPGVGPFRVRQLHFLGADPNVTELRMLIAAPEWATEVQQAFLDHVEKTTSAWDWMILSGVTEGSLLEEGVGRRFSRVEWTRSIPNYYLALEPTWAAFKTKLSRNIKESLRKCYNSLKRDQLDFKLLVVRKPEEVAAAVDTFLTLHKTRADLDTAVRHNNAFAAEGACTFLAEVCTRFAKRDALRIFQLQIQGQTVATRIGFVLGDSLYLYYSGYHPDYAKYSIMTTAVAEAIQYAIAEGFATVNLSTGNDVSKTRWSPTEVMYREALVISPSLRGGLIYEGQARARAAIEASPFSRLLAR